MNDTLLDNEIPKKFKNPETGEVNVTAMAKSYKALEHKMSQAPTLPKSHSEYCIDCTHGVFDPDEDLNRRMFEKGFTNDQVQFVYDIAAEKMVPMVVEMAGDFQADREVEKLIEHFGGVDKWKEISRQLLAFGQKNLPADALDSLSSSFEGVLALHNMMNNEEPKISNGGGAMRSDGTMELQSMMKDPKYWRDKDPSFVAKVTEGFQRMYGK